MCKSSPGNYNVQPGLKTSEVDLHLRQEVASQGDCFSAPECGPSLGSLLTDGEALRNDGI